jgi:hypothetical protein
LYRYGDKQVLISDISKVTRRSPVPVGIDFAKRTVTLFDEGEAMISTSTWPQVGRTVAGLLSPNADGMARLHSYQKELLPRSAMVLRVGPVRIDLLGCIEERTQVWCIFQGILAIVVVFFFSLNVIG